VSVHKLEFLSDFCYLLCFHVGQLLAAVVAKALGNTLISAQLSNAILVVNPMKTKRTSPCSCDGA